MTVKGHVEKYRIGHPIYHVQDLGVTMVGRLVVIHDTTSLLSEYIVTEGGGRLCRNHHQRCKMQIVNKITRVPWHLVRRKVIKIRYP